MILTWKHHEKLVKIHNKKSQQKDIQLQIKWKDKKHFLFVFLLISFEGKFSNALASLPPLTLHTRQFKIKFCKILIFLYYFVLLINLGLSPKSRAPFFYKRQNFINDIVRIELSPLVTNRVNMDTIDQGRLLMKDQLRSMQGACAFLKPS